MKKFLLKVCLVLTVYLPNMGWSQDNRPTVTFVDVLQAEENLHFRFSQPGGMDYDEENCQQLMIFFLKNDVLH